MKTKGDLHRLVEEAPEEEEELNGETLRVFWKKRSRGHCIVIVGVS